MRIVLLLLVLPLIICWNVRSTHANPRIRDVAVIPANTQCLNDREISNAIRKLAAGNAADVDKIHAELITKSSLSVNCRGKIVTGLMKAMDKPKLDFDRDT